MKIGSLFTGYGGLDMAVRQALGGEVAWHCENEPAASAVLAYHWPDVPNHGDITAVDWPQVEPVDALTAGYPCQPFSDAGQRRAEEDERHLWPEVARAIGDMGPRLVVLENVRGHLGRGFAAVLGSLTELGYDTEWATVRASDIGAPHRRERLFAIARPTIRNPDGIAGIPGRSATGLAWQTGSTSRSAADADDIGNHGRRSARDRRIEPADDGRAAADTGRDPRPEADQDRATAAGRGGTAADTASNGRHKGRPEPTRLVGRPDAAERSAVDWGPYGPAVRRWELTLGRPAPAPTEPGRNGKPRLAPAFVEWMMGLPSGHVTGVPGITRNAQLRLLGNGVVPQQAALALTHLLARETAA